MPGIKPKEKVTKKWSPDLAYAVGLLTTDGNLSPDGRHINLTSKDIDQIRTFKCCLGLKNKIGKKSREPGKDKKYFQVQFGDVAFYAWLKSLGLSAKKSKTLGALKIPDGFFFDFLRGHFDGDGCISTYWDRRWHSSYMFYLRFISASLKHLKWLQKTVKRLNRIEGQVKSNSHVYELAFAKKSSRILFDKMYYSENIPSLKRKKLKILEAFHIDEQHNKARVAELVDAHV